MLRRHRAKATFFVVGSAAAAHPELVRRIARDGHVVANHTWGHVDLTRVSERQFLAEVTRTEALLARLAGTTTRLLRPPYGAANAETHRRARRHGYRLALWDVDPQDWRRPGAARIAAAIAAARSGDVVLLHDGGGDRSQTVAALEQALPRLAARGGRLEPM